MMTWTYRWLAALAILGIVGGLDSTAYALDLIGGDMYKPIWFGWILAQIGSIIQMAAIALAIVITYRQRRWGWLATFVAFSVLSVVWLFVFPSLPGLLDLMFAVAGYFGTVVVYDTPLLIGCCLAIIFAMQGARHIRVDEDALGNAGAYWALAALATVAIALNLLKWPVIQAFENAATQAMRHDHASASAASNPGVYFIHVATATSMVAAALMTLAIIAGIAFAAWLGRRGWLVTFTIVGLALNILLDFLIAPYVAPFPTAPNMMPALLQFLKESIYGSAILTVIPCALVLAFGVIEARRAQQRVAIQS